MQETEENDIDMYVTKRDGKIETASYKNNGTYQAFRKSI